MTKRDMKKIIVGTRDELIRKRALVEALMGKCEIPTHTIDEVFEITNPHKRMVEPFFYVDEGKFRNESKHRETCAKGKAKRKKKRRKNH